MMRLNQMCNQTRLPGLLARLAMLSIMLSVMTMMTGCGGDPNPYKAAIDLDKVLSIFNQCLSEQMPESMAAEVKEQGKTDAKVSVGDKEKQAAMTESFLKLFATKLNEAKLMTSTLGARQDAAGAILGFKDANKDGKKDAAEKDVFKIQIDEKASRFVASDMTDDTVHRDRYYRRQHSGAGFWTGFMIGNMMNRQNGFYSGGRARPNFSSMNMAPSGYASSKTYESPKHVKTHGSRSSRTARSSGGSRSFSGGK